MFFLHVYLGAADVYADLLFPIIEARLSAVKFVDSLTLV